MCDCVEKTYKDLCKELDTKVIKFECIPMNFETQKHFFGIRFSYENDKGKMKRSFIRPIYCPMCGRRLGDD